MLLLNRMSTPNLNKMKHYLLQILKHKFFASAFITFVFLIGFNSGFAQTNLITNGDFENGTTNWTVWGATLAKSTDAHSGSGAAKVSNRHNPWDAIVTNLTRIIENEQTYTLSAWVKIPDPAVNFRATLQLNAGGVTTYTGYLGSNSPTIGSYAFYSQTFTLKWTGELVDANLYFETDDVNGVYSDYLLDDVKLVKSNPIVDVIQKGAGWKDIKSSMLIGGCATENGKNYWTNDAAKAQLLTDCNTVTVQCYPGWGRWDETKHHVYHVDEFTNRVKDMKKENMTVTAHMLLGWDQYFPAWFKENDFPADTLEAIVKSWLKGIISYKGNDTLVDVWNVVNEAISWDGKGGYWPLYNANFNDACELQRMGMEPDASGLTGTEYVNAEHPVYIRKAFEYARTLTKKKLELRDSGFEFPANGAKYNAFYQLAVHLKKLNVPVDVIGFQTHIDLEGNYDWEAYSNNIKRYVKLGYEVNIPEVDIGDKAKSWSDDKAELQKLQYYKLITAAIRGGASDFQTWGFIDDGWRTGEKAFPYTGNFERKPAYYGIKEALIDMSSILFWEMNAPTDNTMPDVMKYNNFGTLNNFANPVPVSGYQSKALEFDGIDDYIATGKLSDSISGNLTLSFYLKTATTKAAIISDLSKNENSGLKIGISQEGKIYIEADGSGLNEELTGIKTVNDGQWHFVAVQRDSTNFRLYIDDSNPVEQAFTNLPVFSQLTIGAKNDGTNAFEGAIDEVKLFDSKIEEGSFIRSYAPFAPAKLAIVGPKLRVKLTWSDKSSNEDGFIVERKTADSDWNEIGRVGANVLSYVDILDKYATEYAYRVKAYTSVGQSNESSVVSYLTPNDPATGLSDHSDKTLISVYPNPVKNQFMLTSSPNAQLKIFDINGKLMMIKNNLAAKETIDISGLSCGIYFLQTIGDKKTNVLKLIKN